MTTLTPEAVHTTLKRFFPAKNDDFASDYAEELAELRDFGIATKEQLADLLHRRADEVMEIDRSPMEDEQLQLYATDFGRAFVTYRLQEGFWFSYPALLRIALELEFGTPYEAYASRRDRIVEPVAAPNGGPATPADNSGVTEGPPR